MPLHKCFHIGYSNGHESLTSLSGSPSHMRGDEGIGLHEQWVVGTWWFGTHHIGSIGSQTSISQRIGHILLVDQRTTTRIDEDGSRFHLGKRLLVYHLTRGVGQRAMKGEDVTHSQQSFERCLLDTFGKVG